MNRISLICLTVLLGLSACSQEKDPQQLLQDAQIASANRNYNHAIVQLKNAIQLDINNPDLRLALGKAYLAVGELVNAEKELNRAQDLGMPAEKWLVAMMEVNYLLNEMHSINVLWQEFKSDISATQQQRANFYYGMSLLTQNEQEKGLNELTKVIEQNQNSDAKLVTLSQTVIQLFQDDISDKQVINAISELNQLNQKYPNDWLINLLLAKANFSYQNYQDAALNYEALTKTLPKFDVAYVYAAESNIEAKNYVKANQQLTQLTQAYQSQPYIHQLYAKVNILLENYEQAKNAIEKTLSLNYSDDTTRLIAGLAYYRLAQYENAYRHLNAIADKIPEDHPARKILIATQLHQGNASLAYEELKGSPITSDDSALIAATANALLSQRQNNQALALLNRINIKQSSTPAIAIELGKLKYKLGDESAVDNLDTLIDSVSNIKPTTVDRQNARTLEIASLLQQDKRRIAEDKVAKWIREEPSNLGNYLLMIELKKVQGNTQEINALYHKTLDINPDFVAANLYFAAASLSEKDYPNALAQYQRILQKSPSNHSAILGQYLTLLESKQIAQADIFINKKLTESRTNDGLSLKIAKLFWQRGQYHKAINLLNTQNYQSVRDKVEKLNIIASSQLKLDSIEKAIVAYNDILIVVPNDIKTFIKKVTLLEKLAKFDNILDEFDRFKTKLSENDPRVDLLHAEYLNHQKRSKEAMLLLDSYKQNTVYNDPLFQGTLGKTLYGLGEYADARPLLVSEYKREKSARTALALYNTNMRLNHSQAAIEVVKRHLTLDASNQTFLTILAEYYMNDKKEQAIPIYQQLIEIDNKNGIALNNLAWIYYELQQYEKAKEYIDKAMEYYPENTNILDTSAKILTALSN